MLFLDYHTNIQQKNESIKNGDTNILYRHSYFDILNYQIPSSLATTANFSSALTFVASYSSADANVP